MSPISVVRMIYEDVMKLVPDYWVPMGTDTRYRNIPLQTMYSEEYTHIKSAFEGSYFKASKGLFRVQNPLLWAKFLLKREEYLKRGNVEIKTLYHDTSVCNIDSICQFNFDWRVGQRFMFGPGVYFSIKPDIAFKHSSKKNGPNRAMFLVDVLVQNVQNISEEEIFLPDPGFDTVLAHGNQTFVKYFDCEYYPRYFMMYETYPRDFLPSVWLPGAWL